MRLAILSDIHANLPALEAVLEALEGLSPAALVCLGDLVGYHAEPAACIRLIRQRASVVIAGNHDYDTARQDHALGTGSVARQVQRWTREQLSAEELSYLAGLPSHHIEPGAYVAAHGCYLNTFYVSGYVTSTMLEANLRALEQNPLWPRLGLCGHTHAPLVGWLEAGRCEERRLTAPARWPSTAGAVLLNPGSVGQPRDGDPRASFAVVELEERTITIHRVPYDLERTARALRDARLPEELIDRLREGR